MYTICLAIKAGKVAELYACKIFVLELVRWYPSSASHSLNLVLCMLVCDGEHLDMFVLCAC